ncbi:MAG TPA: multicopper oxidase domain-containing protein [Solirubrobacter sp.]|nr:multicopper oxidase domain-containing protein [Solirubrobacter sp.]
MSATYPSSHPNDQERFDAEVSHYGRVVLKTLAGAGIVAALLISIAALMRANDSGTTTTTTSAAASAPAHHGGGATTTAAAAAPTLADAKGVKFEPFERVDPNLPAVPKGDVKTFKVDVYQHVTQVSKDLAPTEIWSYKVNGVEHRGTGFSQPMVVEVGDTVDFTLTNGSDERMNVTLPHSLDFHSAEVDPGTHYGDLAPGKSMHYRFVANHAGVFMYHCATQPILMHTGMGMIGAMVVKPKGLAPARDLFFTQQEYYIGKPGGAADMDKINAKNPDVIAFNGYANQYKDEPIEVDKGEKIRVWLLNGGPSIWSAFHIIGTVFDKTMVEGVEGHDAQTINLAPSQGAYVEFTLDNEGTYPFLTHAFGDMVKGAMGVLKTKHAPAGAGHSMDDHPAAAAGDVNVKLGEMYVKADKPSFKAGTVKFAVTNEGQTAHGFAIVPAPAKVDGGMLDESAFVAQGKQLAGGEAETVSADLEPGEYELVCFIPGHYMAGQKLPFKVDA